MSTSSGTTRRRAEPRLWRCWRVRARDPRTLRSPTHLDRSRGLIRVADLGERIFQLLPTAAHPRNSVVQNRRNGWCITADIRPPNGNLTPEFFKDRLNRSYTLLLSANGSGRFSATCRTRVGRRRAGRAGYSGSVPDGGVRRLRVEDTNRPIPAVALARYGRGFLYKGTCPDYFLPRRSSYGRRISVNSRV